MRLACVLLVLGLLMYRSLAGNLHGAEIEDNDFAEFEDFDDDDGVEITPSQGAGEKSSQGKSADSPKVVMASDADVHDSDLADDDDAIVEDEDDEFEYFQDEEEFEGFDKDKAPRGKGPDRPADLKFAKVPDYLRTNWDSFYLEMLMLAGLGVYLINFLTGKAKNSKLASAWLSAHKALLEENFSIVGDDGTTQEAQRGILMKESENIYSLWCSGRVCCEGMLVTLKLLKRQDLVSTISRKFRQASDQVIIKITLDQTEMDSFVFCLGNRKAVSKIQKEMVDLASFCQEKKKAETFGLPPSYQLLSEIHEATSSVIDNKVCAALSRYESLVDYIHVSDQYSGPKIQDDTQPSKMPETSKVLLFCFNVPGKGKSSPSDMEDMKPLMMMVFHMLERVRRVKLSANTKTKAEKNRLRLVESYSKASHLQRSEAAQERREKKRRLEKEHMMAEDDPDRQRKLEERSLKKDSKKKQPKVKMMKIKAM